MTIGHQVAKQMSTGYPTGSQPRHTSYGQCEGVRMGYTEGAVTLEAMKKEDGSWGKDSKKKKD